MPDLNVNPKAKAPPIPAWVKWGLLSGFGAFVSWNVSRTLEKYAALKQGDIHVPPTYPEQT